jgi:phenylacetate-CoA ligase
MSSKNPFVPGIELADPGQIRQFQEELLRKQIAYLSSYSPYYRSVFSNNHIEPGDIRNLDDLQKIPFTTKEQLNDFNKDFICVDRSRIVDYITTSGTLGDPVTFVLTDKDLDRLAYNECISFVCSGCSPNDIFQLTTTMDKRFMAGLAYFLGARKLGAGIVRVGAGIPELHWDTIARVQPTTLIAVPSFILKLVEYAEKNNIDYRNSSVRKAICIGEPLRNEDFSLNTLAGHIKEKWDLDLYSTYASTEMSTAFAECAAGQGGHHHPGLIIAEFVDDNGIAVNERQAGEIVITTLGVEGMPLLRFRTGDICHHYSEPCSCGRTTLRVGPLVGRRKQMIKFKGTTVYPPALYDILDGIKEVENYVIEVYTNEIGTDEILIKAGCHAVPDNLEKDIKDHFRARLRVSPAVEFLPVKTVDSLKFPENSRKPVIFFDKRVE